jgi:hypothetical protein
MQTDLFTTESHCKLILKALKRGEKLTPLDILKRFDCLRASGRIHDLRQDGYAIKTEIIKTPTKKRVALYIRS